ncbi:MAG: S-layer homology domain-containing protein [Thermoleophilia bacterium]|nr:S-layer homology domain-containing protein [Thermoleophilia bacterium]
MLLCAPSAKAVTFLPDPPPGWHISRLTAPAWAQLFTLREGVLLASTDLLGGGGMQARYDAYRLQPAVGQTGPVATRLRGAVQGEVLSLDDGLVLYRAPRPGTDPEAYVSDLFVRDLASGATTRIPMPAGLTLSAEGSPVVADGVVVWSQTGLGHPSQVMLYDTATESLRSLSAGSVESHDSASIDGDDVVWQTWDGGSRRVLHYNRATGATEELARDLPWSVSLHPQVAAGRVIWVTGEWIGPEAYESSLFMHDLSSGVTQLVSRVRGPNSRIIATLSGDLLVTLVSYDASHFELLARNLSTDSVRSLANLQAQPLSLSVADRMVAWQDLSAQPTGQGYLGKIFLYEDVGGRVTKLAEGVGVGRPIVDQGRVLIMHTVDAVTATLWLAERDDAEPYDHYLDVQPDRAYGEAILDFSARGFVAGYETGAFRTFHPTYPLRRAQLAKILVNAFGLPVEEGMSSSFEDLGPDSIIDLYPHAYVAAATRADLLKGYSPSSFGPWDQLTRAQLVTVLVRAAGRFAPSALSNPPAGYLGSVTGAPEVHAANLRIAEHSGLLQNLTGFGPGWDPNSFARRGEVVQALYDLRKAIEGD